jgi:DNA modification methylase
MPQAPWAASAVEARAVASLLPYAGNARTHSAEQVAQIAASILEFGFVAPVLVDERGEIIAGHGRLLAAQSLGLETVPTIVRAGLTEAQKAALRLADNGIALNAGWDEALLAAELAKLQEAGEVDLAFTGFAAEEIDRLLAGLDALATEPGNPAVATPAVASGAVASDAPVQEEAEDPADAKPDPPRQAVTRPGDLWLLGEHRLLCGDATSAADVARLLNGTRPHLMVTDPPYGVNYDPAWRNEACVFARRRTGKVANDDRADWREAWALFPGDVAYVWHAGVHARTVIESLEAAGFVVRSQIIWAKSRFVLGRGDYHWQHEPCFYAVRKGATGHWQGARDQTTLWQIAMVGSEDDAETVHGTQKPLECMRRPILNNSAPGEAVYDPFLGSGTTLIAAELTRRICFGIDIDPRYCDLVVERWQRLTGSTAILDGDGRCFADLKDQRVAA